MMKPVSTALVILCSFIFSSVAVHADSPGQAEREAHKESMKSR